MTTREEELIALYNKLNESIAETSKEMVNYIREVVKTTPNDEELGKVIREVFTGNTNKN